MARDRGLDAPQVEAELALSLSHLGKGDAAQEAIARAQEKARVPHLQVAEFYATISDKEAARTHAVAAYKEAWADGPPFAHHWYLERCRAVLRAIGEAEPVLPPFDPASITPFPFEGEVRAMLQRHAARQKPPPDQPQ